MWQKKNAVWVYGCFGCFLEIQMQYDWNIYKLHGNMTYNSLAYITVGLILLGWSNFYPSIPLLQYKASLTTHSLGHVHSAWGILFISAPIVLLCPSVTFTTHSTYITYSIHLETEAVFPFFSIFGGLFTCIRMIAWWRPLSWAFGARVQLSRLFRCARLVQHSRVFCFIPHWSRASVLYRESFCGLQLNK